MMVRIPILLQLKLQRFPDAMGSGEMNHSQFRPVGTAFVPANSYKRSQHKTNNQQPFAVQLQSALQTNSKLSVSKHAQERLKQRNIHVPADSWAKIEQKVSEAKQMGVTDSLVLLPNAALIVSAKNQTVITALDRDEASSQIFTNINGTIVLE